MQQKRIITKPEQCERRLTCIRACILVRRCLDSGICENFQGYFELQQHKTETRNSECLIRLPCIKTEYAMKSFHFMLEKLNLLGNIKN